LQVKTILIKKFVGILGKLFLQQTLIEPFAFISLFPQNTEKNSAPKTS